MKNKKLVIIGGGGFSKKIIRLIQKEFSYSIIGYTELEDKGALFGIKHIGNDKIIHDLNHSVDNLGIILGIGANLEFSISRKNIIDELKKNNIFCPSILSSRSITDDTIKIGSGVIVFPGSLIEHNVLIDDFSIININSTICHDNIIGKNVFLSPSSTIAGSCIIGDDVFIGTNVTINPGIHINSGIIIGSGSVVTKNLLKRGIYFGNPAVEYVKH